MFLTTMLLLMNVGDLSTNQFVNCELKGVMVHLKTMVTYQTSNGKEACTVQFNCDLKATQ